MELESTNKRTALYIICTVWFFWGFVAASHGVFIPFCKNYFSLNQFQSQLIESAFYGAYFMGSLSLWLFSQITKIDLLNYWGYKKTIIIGLLISVGGALLIILSVHVGTYELILGSFFVIALGFSLQQVASQPYIVSLGSPETGAYRISFGGAFNNFGTLLGPLIVSVILFGSFKTQNVQPSVRSIDTLYAYLGMLFLISASLLYFSKLPDERRNEPFERGFKVFSYPQLVLGMMAIFVYVGTEVTIQSNMGELLKQPNFGGYTTDQISTFVSLYWGYKKTIIIGLLISA